MATGPRTRPPVQMVNEQRHERIVRVLDTGIDHAVARRDTILPRNSVLWMEADRCVRLVRALRYAIMRGEDDLQGPLL